MHNADKICKVLCPGQEPAGNKDGDPRKGEMNPVSPVTAPVEGTGTGSPGPGRRWLRELQEPAAPAWSPPRAEGWRHQPLTLAGQPRCPAHQQECATSCLVGHRQGLQKKQNSHELQLVRYPHGTRTAKGGGKPPKSCRHGKGKHCSRHERAGRAALRRGQTERDNWKPG